MPGTIKDDKSVIAQTSSVELQKHRARFENLAGFAANNKQPQASTPKLVNSNWSGGLAALLLICLAVRVDAVFVKSDCDHPIYFNCRDAYQFLDLVNSMYAGSPNQFITIRHNGYGWYGYLKTGDYHDRWWYLYLNEGQYCYPDRVQYKLLGELNYILGHQHYPNLFGRSPVQAFGFANRWRIYTPWYDCNWNYPIAGQPVSPGNIYTGYIGQIPIDNYVICYCCSKPRSYLYKWRYHRYEFGTPYSWFWHTYGSPYCYNYYFLKNLKKEKIPPIPEPATVGFLGLGALFVLILRNKRRV